MKILGSARQQDIETTAIQNTEFRTGLKEKMRYLNRNLDKRSSVFKCLSSICEVLGSIPRTTKNNKQNENKEERVTPSKISSYFPLKCEYVLINKYCIGNLNFNISENVLFI